MRNPGRGHGNLVIIGSKPIMNYVVACLTLFNSGVETVYIRARGRHISKAIDSIELLRRIFIKDATVKNIEIGTDVLTRDDGEKANVSTIEILLSPF
ncbi:MAG: DNA-binding protein Alba [Candidatus Korarchaeota archaeon]|nr:DNA-binding protein Alba [Candidatus Thorarchaeota archaeon]NIW53111.1 DNA-binding protein Alba [Candidatus Korarchaeota archaeon]